MRQIDYDLFGFCLGLSPTVYGEEGPFVQSDIQFVQQVADDILTFHPDGFFGLLEPWVVMDVGTRFFVTESTTPNGAPTRDMIASSLYVSYGK